MQVPIRYRRFFIGIDLFLSYSKQVQNKRKNITIDQIKYCVVLSVPVCKMEPRLGGCLLYFFLLFRINMYDVPSVFFFFVLCLNLMFNYLLIRVIIITSLSHSYVIRSWKYYVHLKMKWLHFY